MGEYIDDFEKMEAEIEQKSKNSCYNCKYSTVPANKEPCASCRNRNKWEEREDGEK
jgi:hypothetical protein